MMIVRAGTLLSIARMMTKRVVLRLFLLKPSQYVGATKIFMYSKVFQVTNNTSLGLIAFDFIVVVSIRFD